MTQPVSVIPRVLASLGRVWPQRSPGRAARRRDSRSGGGGRTTGLPGPAEGLGRRDGFYDSRAAFAEDLHRDIGIEIPAALEYYIHGSRASILSYGLQQGQPFVQ